MPKLRSRNTPPRIMSNGLRREETKTNTERLIAYIHDQLFRNPAKSQIVRYLYHLRDLGFDLNEPGMIERAISAGQHAQAKDDARAEEREAAIATKGGRHDPIVYYMRMGDLVKVGTTVNIGQRWTNIQPEEVLAIEPGDETLELLRHRQFALSHSHGEWFHLAEPMLAHVAMLHDHWLTQTGDTVEAWLAARLPRRKQRSSSASTPVPLPAGRAPRASSPRGDSGSAVRRLPSGQLVRLPKRRDGQLDG